MDIIAEVKKLDLPANEYVVFSGGTLHVLGIRDTNDIDLFVTTGLFEDLMKDGSWSLVENFNRRFLKKGIVEIADTLPESFPKSHREIVDGAMFVEGIPFMSLEDVLLFKKSINPPREKDLRDIELIENYLAQKA